MNVKSVVGCNRTDRGGNHGKASPKGSARVCRRCCIRWRRGPHHPHPTGVGRGSKSRFLQGAGVGDRAIKAAPKQTQGWLVRAQIYDSQGDLPGPSPITAQS